MWVLWMKLAPPPEAVSDPPGSLRYDEVLDGLRIDLGDQIVRYRALLMCNAILVYVDCSYATTIASWKRIALAILVHSRQICRQKALDLCSHVP